MTRDQRDNSGSDEQATVRSLAMKQSRARDIFRTLASDIRGNEGGDSSRHPSHLRIGVPDATSQHPALAHPVCLRRVSRVHA